MRKATPREHHAVHFILRSYTAMDEATLRHIVRRVLRAMSKKQAKEAVATHEASLDSYELVYTGETAWVNLFSTAQYELHKEHEAWVAKGVAREAATQARRQAAKEARAAARKAA